MPYSKFRTLWKNTLPLTSLKIINVSYSENLETTPDFRDLKLVEKLLFSGCKSLLEVHPSIGQLTDLYHLDLGQCDNLKELCEPIGQLTELGYLDLRGCVNMKQLPNSFQQLTKLGRLDLSGCCSLTSLPEQLGDMKGLKIIDASDTAIEQLPDSIAHLKELVELKLNGCWKLNKLPEQLGDMEGLKMLDASDTPIEQLPCSIGQLKELVELNLYGCKNLTSLPNSIWKLKLLKVLHLGYFIQLEQLPDTINMKKLELLNMSCNVRLWLPIILSFSSLKELTLIDQGESFSSTEPCSLSTLSNLRRLTLHNCTSLGSSFPELPLNLEFLWVHNYATLEQLPDLSSFKQLNHFYISNCISLQSLAPLPPHLQSLAAHECTSLQHVPDLSTMKELVSLSFIGSRSNLKSVSLKESSLQVTDILDSSSSADLLNSWVIPEWLSDKSSVCTFTIEIPPILGDNFWGIALCLVYKFKTHSRYLSYIRAVFNNKTEGITNNYKIYVPTHYTAEAVQSMIECTRGDHISVKSGDIIEVSLQTLLYSNTAESLRDADGEVKVEKCGAHVIQKTPFIPY